jgi:hypothetical protein
VCASGVVHLLVQMFGHARVLWQGAYQAEIYNRNNKIRKYDHHRNLRNTKICGVILKNLRRDHGRNSV